MEISKIKNLNNLSEAEKLKTTIIELEGDEEYEELTLAINENKNKEDILKELCDLVYVCIGFADTYGWDFDVAFNKVHQSNMSKLDKNGDPIYRKDGKILKSELYEEPNLQDLV